MLYQWSVRVQSDLSSYLLSAMGCEGGLCAGYDFPGKPMYETWGAGVWDRKSLQEGGREGFDKLYLFFSFLFFRIKSFLLMISLARLGGSLKTGGGGSGENFPLGRMF